MSARSNPSYHAAFYLLSRRTNHPANCCCCFRYPGKSTGKLRCFLYPGKSTVKFNLLSINWQVHPLCEVRGRPGDGPLSTCHHLMPTAELSYQETGVRMYSDIAPTSARKP
eukprot:1160302-Pelagomonas_calceolata.AAC.3